MSSRKDQNESGGHRNRDGMGGNSLPPQEELDDSVPFISCDFAVEHRRRLRSDLPPGPGDAAQFRLVLYLGPWGVRRRGCGLEAAGPRRSDERWGGKEGVGPCRFWWARTQQ